MGGEGGEQGTQTVLLWDPGGQLLQESLRNRASRGETVNCVSRNLLQEETVSPKMIVMACHIPRLGKA